MRPWGRTPAETTKRQSLSLRNIVFTVLAFAVLIGTIVLYGRHAEERQRMLRDVAVTKSIFRVDVLAKSPDLTRSESIFMRYCTECAPAAVCEQDRITIRSGSGSDDYNPCK
jgi:hypothetical protein